MTTEFPNCRFLTTALSPSDEDISSGELQQQTAEFLDNARNFLCGHTYFEVYDTFDTLIQDLNGVLGRKKKAL